ncbi:MAG: hypothetical protein J7L53_10620 [Deltaproteobacteria bacterium]|nr:hypothetical protein [Deltaproteobacteria bacterium]
MKVHKCLILGVIFLILPQDSSAAKLHLSMPKGTSGVQLLSFGTSSVLDHMHENLDKQLKTLNAKYKIEQLKTDADKAKALEAQLFKKYKDEIASIKDSYISKISIKITSAKTEVSPESSTLGETAFSYTAKNSSDRIVGSIMYRPIVGDIVAPTPSMLTLEFIDSKTFKFGLAPGSVMKNVPDQLERFSFFIGELTTRELQFIKANINKSLWIDITDIRFLNKIDYKDQTRLMDVEEAFEPQLKPLLSLAQQAHRKAKIKEESYKKALNDYNQAKDKIIAQFKSASEDLKRASFRYSAQGVKNNRYRFKGVSPGRYIIYAYVGKDSAIFQPVEIKDTRQELTIQEIIKDPFLP